MTLEEFDVELDILYNNISSNKAPGLNALEKSIFLTEAQDLLVKEYYSRIQNGFESNEEITEYLQTLVRQKKYNSTDAGVLQNGNHIIEGSYLFKIPDDLMFITYESALVKSKCGNTLALVQPVTQDMFYKTYENPFRGPDSHRVLRLLVNNNIELVTNRNNPINEYTLRYLSNPKPIILIGASEYGMEPYNIITGQNTELPESFHRNILLKAVQLADAAWKS